MGSKTTKSKRGRKLLVLAVIGLGAVAFKASRSQSGAAPQAWTPAPAPTPTPAPAPAPAVEPDVQSEASPIEQLETEAPAPLAEPIVDAAAEETQAIDLSETAASPTDGLHDIVEEPWVEETEVTPVPEVPEDSLTSFFDEVMTDTAERKLRKGR